MAAAVFTIVFGLVLTTTTVTTTLHDCPQNLPTNVYTKSLPGKCYAFFEQTENYASALENCKMYNGILAMPKTKIINDFLADTLRYDVQATNRFWIGLTDLEEENVFRWADDTRLDAALHYFSNFPFGEGTRRFFPKFASEDCVAIDKNGTWHDYLCQPFLLVFGEELEFICQFDTEPKPTTNAPLTPSTETSKRLTVAGTTTMRTKTTIGLRLSSTKQTTAPLPIEPSTQNATERATETTTGFTMTTRIENATQTRTASTSQPKIETTFQPATEPATQAAVTCTPLSILCPDLNCGFDGYRINAVTNCYLCECSQ